MTGLGQMSLYKYFLSKVIATPVQLVVGPVVDSYDQDIMCKSPLFSSSLLCLLFFFFGVFDGLT